MVNLVDLVLEWWLDHFNNCLETNTNAIREAVQKEMFENSSTVTSKANKFTILEQMALGLGLWVWHVPTVTTKKKQKTNDTLAWSCLVYVVTMATLSRFGTDFQCARRWWLCGGGLFFTRTSYLNSVRTSWTVIFSVKHTQTHSIAPKHTTWRQVILTQPNISHAFSRWRTFSTWLCLYPDASHEYTPVQLIHFVWRHFFYSFTLKIYKLHLFACLYMEETQHRMLINPNGPNECAYSAISLMTNSN